MSAIERVEEALKLGYLPDDDEGDLSEVIRLAKVGRNLIHLAEAISGFGSDMSVDELDK